MRSTKGAVMSERFRTTVIASSRAEAIATAERQARDWFGTEDVSARLVSAQPHTGSCDGTVGAYEADFECRMLEPKPCRRVGP